MIRIGIDPGVHKCGVAIAQYKTWPGHGMARVTCSAFVARADYAEMPCVTGMDMASQIVLRLQPMADGPVCICIEGQQIYPSEKSEGDPNDMVKVAVVAGALAGALAYACAVSNTPKPRLAMPLPREWKGSVPKDIHHKRLARDYPHWVEPVEADTPKSLQNHVWDAVGLLEWHKERSEK